jgi:hypothetical protein
VDPRRLLPVLTAVACACVVATLVVTLARPGERRPATSPDTSPAISRAREASGAVRATHAPVRVLGRWEARRSAAWAVGDVAALRELYARGSRAGVADVRLLRRYRERGLTVEGLTTQVLAVRVVERSRRRMVLVVTDRVVAGRVVGGPAPVALPSDRASTRTVVLVRPGAAWVVAEARDQDSAAASTSRTSSSSKS